MAYQEPYHPGDGSGEKCDVMIQKIKPFIVEELPKEDGFFVASAALCIYESNALENVGHNLSDTTRLINKISKREQLEEDSELDSEQLTRRREVTQHFQVLTTMYEYAREKKPLTVEVICEWHQTLMAGLLPPEDCGKLRTDAVMAGQKIFPDARLVPNLFQDLLEQYETKKSQLSCFAFAAWFSHAFVSIHPFIDGNGRMCRLLMNYILWCAGFRFAVAASKDRSSYFKALRVADRDYDDGQRTGQLAYLLVEQAYSIVSNFLANEQLKAEFL